MPSIQNTPLSYVCIVHPCNYRIWSHPNRLALCSQQFSDSLKFGRNTNPSPDQTMTLPTHGESQTRACNSRPWIAIIFRRSRLRPPSFKSYKAIVPYPWITSHGNQAAVENARSHLLLLDENGRTTGDEERYSRTKLIHTALTHLTGRDSFTHTTYSSAICPLYVKKTFPNNLHLEWVMIGISQKPMATITVWKPRRPS